MRSDAASLSGEGESLSDDQVKGLGFDPRKVVFVLVGPTLYRKTDGNVWEPYPPYPG